MRPPHLLCAPVDWKLNSIPQFDPRMSSLALLEAETPSPLYVTGVDGGYCCLPLMYGCGGSYDG